MPRNTFKCPECGGNYKHCKFQRGLSRTASAGLPKKEEKKVYICNGQQWRHPHTPILIEAHMIFVRASDDGKNEAKRRLHTMKLNLIYIDALFEEYENFKQWARVNFSPVGIKRRESFKVI